VNESKITANGLMPRYFKER